MKNQVSTSARVIPALVGADYGQWRCRCVPAIEPVPERCPPARFPLGLSWRVVARVLPTSAHPDAPYRGENPSIYAVADAPASRARRGRRRGTRASIHILPLPLSALPPPPPPAPLRSPAAPGAPRFSPLAATRRVTVPTHGRSLGSLGCIRPRRTCAGLMFWPPVSVPSL